jgi:uncharacterized iron-regulated membrane protein
MTFKQIILKIHLWLGLASGLVVFIVAVTGCLYAFQYEIQEITQPYRRVIPQSKPLLTPTQLKAIAEKQLPGKAIHSVEYQQKDRAAITVFYHYEPTYYYFVYLNPYTGEVLKVKNEDKDFFRIVLMGHYYLWLPPIIGQPIVASSTLIFLILMITGIILWFPKKNVNAIRQRFTIKWDARWRRKNFDLHAVVGFYITWIVIFLTITGLVWGFQWFAKGLYTLAGGEKSLLYEEPLSDTTQTLKTLDMPATDKIWHKIKSENQNAQKIEVHFPETSKSSLLVVTNADSKTYWQSDYQYFDQYTLKEIPVKNIYSRFKDARAADKLIRLNYDIHVGAIGGLPGKLLAFFASLITASLPVTGVLLWWGRRNKDSSKPNQKKASTVI